MLSKEINVNKESVQEAQSNGVAADGVEAATA